jgi:hypothetical protein
MRTSSTASTSQSKSAPAPPKHFSPNGKRRWTKLMTSWGDLE